MQAKIRGDMYSGTQLARQPVIRRPPTEAGTAWTDAVSCKRRLYSNSEQINHCHCYNTTIMLSDDLYKFKIFCLVHIFIHCNSQLPVVLFTDYFTVQESSWSLTDPRDAEA